MKKIIILIFAVSLTQISIAQKCKAHISNEDKITEKTTNLWGGKLDSKSTIANGKGYDLKFLVAKDADENNKPYAILHVTHNVHESRSDVFDISFQEGSKYIIKTDGGLIELTIDKIFKNNNKFMSTYSVINQLVGYVSKEDIEKLSKETILMYRVVSTNGVSVEGEVSKRASKNLKQQISCFFSEL